MSKSVLIVDDSATLRASVKFTLSEAGYSVQEAVNGKDGLQKLQELQTKGDQVSLIISDINMPEMDGIAFIREVKRNLSFKFIPVLILTTESQESKKMEGKAAGAAGWLVKPFSNDQLIDVVKKFVR
ncbi:MAG: response regulator [Firmicutes bacterium]|nr:response regulator [Bacillota bacterium]